MTTESLFADVTPDSNAQDANSPRTFGVDIEAAVDGQISAIRYYIDSLNLNDAPATVKGAVFDPTNSTTVPLSSGTATPAGDGWLSVPLDAAVDITAEHTYTACAWIDKTATDTQPNYDYKNAGLSSAVTVGDLTAVAHTGRFENNTSDLTYPTNTTDLNFMVDVEFTAGASSETPSLPGRIEVAISAGRIAPAATTGRIVAATSSARIDRS